MNYVTDFVYLTMSIHLLVIEVKLEHIHIKKWHIYKYMCIFIWNSILAPLICNPSANIAQVYHIYAPYLPYVPYAPYLPYAPYAPHVPFTTYVPYTYECSLNLYHKYLNIDEPSKNAACMCIHHVLAI